MAQIAEYLTKDPVTNQECIPTFSAVTLKKKKKMLFAPMDFQDLTLDALIVSVPFSILRTLQLYIRNRLQQNTPNVSKRHS